MAERTKCMVCGGSYARILDHVRKEHNYKVNGMEAAHMGLYVCGCGAVLGSKSGEKAHQARMKERCSVWVSKENKDTDDNDGQVDTADSIATPPSDIDDSIMEKFIELAGASGVNRPLNPMWASTFRQVVQRLARMYMEEPSEKNLYYIMALPKSGLASCLTQAASGNRQARSVLAGYPHSQPDVQRSTILQNQTSRTHKVQRYVQQGRLGSASRLLCSDSKVLSLTEDVTKALKDKHPEGEDGPFDRWEGDVPGSMPEAELAQNLLRQFKPDTAAGISGWTHALMTQAFKVEKFQSFFNLLIKQVIQNQAPGKQMLCASRLTPLAKPDGGVRPIAVGELFYRLIMKCIIRKYFYRSSLHPYQLGVGSKGGVEPIVYAMETFIEAEPAKYSHVISLDFSNAFNTLNRSTLASSVHKHLRAMYRPCKWAYGEPTPLVVSDGSTITNIVSSQGVRQGDPLGPLLFSLGVKDVLEGLQEVLGSDSLVLAYLDDVFVFTQGDILDDIEEYFTAQDINISLNRSKCKVVSRESIIEDGFSLLGTVVGSKEARVGFLRKKIAGINDKLHNLNELPSQHSFLLLTRCIQQDLRHLQRTLRTDDMLNEWDSLDLSLWDTLKALRSSPRSLPWDHRLFSLPTSMGGLGIPSHREIAPLAYATMVETAEETLMPLIDPETDGSSSIIKSQRERCFEHYMQCHQQLLNSFTNKQQNILVDNASKLGRKWMTTIPFNKALELSDSDISVALHIRTLCPGQSELCSHCGLVNEAGHDDTCNSRPNRRLRRHEHIKGLLIKHLRMAPNSQVLPEPMTKDSNPRTDIRVSGEASVAGGQSEYDLSITAPTADYKVSGRDLDVANTPSQRFRIQLASIEKEKFNKYTGKTLTPFRPLVLSAGGTLAQGTETVFKHWRSKVPQWDVLNRLISIGLIRARSTYFDL